MSSLARAQRGQASIEFILVLVFALVILIAIIVPIGQRSQHALEDVSKAGFSSSAINRLDYTITTMTSIPGSSRQNFDLYLPKGASFICSPTSVSPNGNRVGILFPLYSSVFDSTGNVPADCVDASSSPNQYGASMFCTKWFTLPTYIQLHCQGVSDAGYAIDTGQNGFSQRFNMTGRMPTSNSYIIDLNAV